MVIAYPATRMMMTAQTAMKIHFLRMYLRYSSNVSSDALEPSPLWDHPWTAPTTEPLSLQSSGPVCSYMIPPVESGLAAAV